MCIFFEADNIIWASVIFDTLAKSSHNFVQKLSFLGTFSLHGVSDIPGYLPALLFSVLFSITYDDAIDIQRATSCPFAYQRLLELHV